MTYQNHGVAIRLPNNNIHPFPALVGPVHPSAVLQNVLDYSVQERMYQVCLQAFALTRFCWPNWHISA